MDRTTTVALMAAILAAPRKGDYSAVYMADLAGELYDEVTKITRPLDGATVLGIVDDEPTLEYPALWLDVAKARGAKPDTVGNYDFAELERVGVSGLNGCPGCGATVAPYNSYKVSEESDYTYCRECAGVSLARGL